MYKLTKLKQGSRDGKIFSMITAYDYTQAKLATAAGIDTILVGDSLGNVVQGLDSTVAVTVEDICYHTSCVAAGANGNFVIADMPFGSINSIEQALDNASLIMQAGANMVKIECDAWAEDIVGQLSNRGIPVCAHLGLKPQMVNKIGGYKKQGTESEQAEAILQSSIFIQNAGADFILLECVDAKLAKTMQSSLDIPVIAIGCNAVVDAQVLVFYDVIGVSDNPPSFVKNYMNDASSIAQALENYHKEVVSGKYPYLVEN